MNVPVVANSGYYIANEEINYNNMHFIWIYTLKQDH